MTWYWTREGDSIVIRTEPEGDDAGEDYIAEIDIRYLTPADRQKAEGIANRITDAENRRLYDLEANAAAWAKAKEDRWQNTHRRHSDTAPD